MKFLSSPTLLFYALPYLMGLLVVGTVAQKWMGLHLALETFFFSWVIWFSVIPIPGGLVVMSIITVNLAFKFLLQSKWSLQKFGTNLVHLGVLVLMIGGVGALIFKTESVMILYPDVPNNTVQDYIETDFSIVKNGDYFVRFDFDHLSRCYSREAKNLIKCMSVAKLHTCGSPMINHALHDLEDDERRCLDIPFEFTILDTCNPCEIVLRPEDEKDGWVGASGSMMLVDGARPLNAEETIQGVSFEVSGLGKQDGKYLTFEGFPKPPEFKIDHDIYHVIVERRKSDLPFSMVLNEFEKVFYEGTQRAKDYESRISVIDGDVKFSEIINMNDPFRYKNYTFYQSSFIGDEVSVLAVVENRAFLFPYLASLLVTMGLIWHVILLKKSLGRRKK